MIQTTRREWAIDIALRYHGTFYGWGGDDPSLFDCSGLSGEILTSVGVFPRGTDMTAASQYAWLMGHGFQYGPLEDKLIPVVKPGWLIFFSKTSNPADIHHVEMALSCGLSIGAAGGGSKTLTREDAIKQNAFVKIRPIAGRGFQMFFADPFSK